MSVTWKNSEIQYIMSSDWKDSILKILQKIYTRRESEDFRHPVPWKELGLTDYPEVKSTLQIVGPSAECKVIILN